MAEVSAAVLAAAAFPAHTAPLAGGVALPPGSLPFANASGALAGVAGFARDPTTGLVTLGSGDTETIFTSYAASLPQRVAVAHGTAASPLTTFGPTLKVVRTEELTRAALEAATAVGNDGGEQVAAIYGISAGTAATEIQTVGVYAAAKSASTSAVAGHDACGLYATARMSGSGTALNFFAARRDNDTANANAAEFAVNNSGTLAPTWASGAFSKLTGIWLHADGNANSSVGISFGNPFGRQFDVGIGFTSQTNNALVGGVASASINDQSSSLSAHTIGGSHNYGIDLSGTFANSAIRVGAAPGTSSVDILAAASTVGMTVRGSGGNIAVFRNNAAGSVMFVNEAGTTFNNNTGWSNTGTVGESMLVKYSEELLTLGTGAATTDSVGNLLPANSLILAVAVRVTTAITTATSFSVGDATTAARFASGVAVALNTTANGISQANGGVAAGAGMMQTAAAKVRITSNVTPGAGVVRITVAYMQFSAPTS